MWLVLACVGPPPPAAGDAADPAPHAGDTADSGADTAEGADTAAAALPAWTDCQRAIDVGTLGERVDSHLVYAPTVVAIEGGYRMWYSATAWSGETAIATATSVDGVSWTGHRVVLEPGAAGDTDRYVVTSPHVLRDGDGYVLYYDGSGGGDVGGIHRCTSADGLTWSECTFLFGRGLLPPYDVDGAQMPFVLRDGATWRLYYGGVEGGTYRVLYAESADGVAFSGHRLLLPPGSEGNWDAESTYAPFVAPDPGGGWRMLYTGRAHIDPADGTSYQVKRLIRAWSPDGLAWQNFRLSMDLGCAGADDAWRADEAWVLPDGDGVRLWYDGFDAPETDVGLRRILTATATDW